MATKTYPKVPFHLDQVHELAWVTITGQGKKKYDPENKLDDSDPLSYVYQASAVLNKAQKEEVEKRLNAFWLENRPAKGIKQNYNLIRAEVADKLDKSGNPVLDSDGDPIKEETGRYYLAFTTNTHIAKGKGATRTLTPKSIKVLRPDGKTPLNLGDKQIGNGSTGIIHGILTINDFKSNEGLSLYLTAVQLKKFVPYDPDMVEAESIGDEIEGLDDNEVDGIDDPSEAGNTVDTDEVNI